MEMEEKRGGNEKLAQNIEEEPNIFSIWFLNCLGELI